MVLAGTLLTDLLTRLRDPNATMLATDTPPSTASGRAFALGLISDCQRLVNIAERQRVAYGDLPLTSGDALYVLANVFPDYAGRVLSVTRETDSTEVDGPTDFRALGRASRTWLTDTGTPAVWAMIGQSLLAVVPTPATGTRVAVRYLRLLPAIAADTDAMLLADDTVEHVTRLAALVGRLKTRQLVSFVDELKSLAGDMQQATALSDTGGDAD